MRAQKLPNLFWAHIYMHYFQSVVTYNAISSMYVRMHTAVPAAHCAMVYYAVHNINFYNQKNRTHGFRPGTPTYHFGITWAVSCTGSLLFFSNNH